MVMVFSAMQSMAQDTTKFEQVIQQINTEKSANVKDILTPLFRAGIGNLLGKKREFTFSSSFYGIDSIFKGKGSERFDTSKFLRRNSLDLGLTGDSSNNIMKLSVGFNFSIIDKKDIRYNQFNALNTGQLKEKVQVDRLFGIGITNYFDEKDKSAVPAVRQSLNDAFERHDFSKIDPRIKTAIEDPVLLKMILALAKETKVDLNEAVVKATLSDMLDGKDSAAALLQNIISNYAQNALWVIKPVYSYDRSAKQGEYAVESKFTTGVFKNFAKKPWELEVFSKFLIGNDSTKNIPNYNNKPLLVSIGINKVVLQNEENASRMEFKFFSSYQYQFGSTTTKQAEFALNTTLRLNVFKSLWLPITVKYEPNGGNLFGYFSITANLGN
jgi:hypothetical protein